MRKTAPAHAGSRSVGTDVTTPLILDLLHWLGAGAKPYAEVMDAWRTSCPRMTVWEDAVEAGYVVRKRIGRSEPVVEVTALGRKRLGAAGR